MGISESITDILQIKITIWVQIIRLIQCSLLIFFSQSYYSI